MLTVIIIVAMLGFWAVLGPMAFVRDSSRVRVFHCPTCGYSGKASGIGRFRCSVCGHPFVLGPAGEWILPLVGVVGGGLLLVSVCVSFVTRGTDPNFAAVFAVQLAAVIGNTFYSKRFPNVYD